MNPTQSRPHTLRRAIAVILSLLAIGLGCWFGCATNDKQIQQERREHSGHLE